MQSLDDLQHETAEKQNKYEFVFSLRDTACICCCGPSHAAIDRYLLPAGPTAANPPPRRRMMAHTDGQTEGRRHLHRHCFAVRISREQCQNLQVLVSLLGYRNFRVSVFVRSARFRDFSYLHTSACCSVHNELKGVYCHCPSSENTYIYIKATCH